MFDLKYTENNKPVIIYLGQGELETTIYMLNPWEIISDKFIIHKFYNKNDWMVFTLDSEK